MKKQALILALLASAAFSSSDEIFLFPKPEKRLSLYSYVQSHYTLKKDFPPLAPWITAGSSARFSMPLLHPSLIGILQGSIGSQGLDLQAEAQWTLFPDYNYQPAIGVLVNLAGGLDQKKSFYVSSHGSLFVIKTFVFNNGWIRALSPFVTPTVKWSQTKAAIAKKYQFHWDIPFGFFIQHTSNRFLSSGFLTGLSIIYKKNRGFSSLHTHVYIPF